MPHDILDGFSERVSDLDAGQTASKTVNLYGDVYTVVATSEPSESGGVLGFFSAKVYGVRLEINHDGDLITTGKVSRPVTPQTALWSVLELLVDAHHHRDPNDAIRRLARGAIRQRAGRTVEYETHILGTDYSFVAMGADSRSETGGLWSFLRWRDFQKDSIDIALFRNGDVVEQYETGDLTQRMYLDGPLTKLPIFGDGGDVRDQFVEDVRRFGVLAHVRAKAKR